jgi:hypothetical protein
MRVAAVELIDTWYVDSGNPEGIDHLGEQAQRAGEAVHHGSGRR